MEIDSELYKRRNEIGRFFLRLKRFRKVFTRYDKLDVIYFSVVTLALIFDAFLCEQALILTFVRTLQLYTAELNAFFALWKRLRL